MQLVVLCKRAKLVLNGASQAFMGVGQEGILRIPELKCKIPLVVEVMLNAHSLEAALGGFVGPGSHPLVSADFAEIEKKGCIFIVDPVAHTLQYG